MRACKYIVLLCALVVMAGCGTKKKLVDSQEPIAKSEPTWHTCLIQNARATVTMNEDRVAANVTMQTVRDSMIIISVMPLMGMEMIRVEATPLELTAIDKIHGRYAKASYAELNNRLTPSLNWDVLQQLCSAELPTGSERARLVYSFGEQMIELVIVYPARKIDVPVRVTSLPLKKYQQIDISKWL